MPVGPRPAPNVTQVGNAPQSQGALQQGAQNLQGAYAQAGQTAASGIQSPRGGGGGGGQTGSLSGLASFLPGLAGGVGAAIAPWVEKKRQAEADKRQRELMTFQDDLARSREVDKSTLELAINSANRKYTSALAAYADEKNQFRQRKADTLARLKTQIDSATDPEAARTLLTAYNKVSSYEPYQGDYLQRAADEVNRAEQAALQSVRGAKRGQATVPAEASPDFESLPYTNLPRPVVRDLQRGGGIASDVAAVPLENQFMDPTVVAETAYALSRINQIEDLDTRQRVTAAWRRNAYTTADKLEETNTLISNVENLQATRAPEIAQNAVSQALFGLNASVTGPNGVSMLRTANPQQFSQSIVQNVLNSVEDPSLKKFAMDVIAGTRKLDAPGTPDAMGATLLASTQLSALFEETGRQLLDAASDQMTDPDSLRSRVMKGYDKFDVGRGGSSFSRDALMKAGTELTVLGQKFQQSSALAAYTKALHTGRAMKAGFRLTPTRDATGKQTGTTASFDPSVIAGMSPEELGGLGLPGGPNDMNDPLFIMSNIGTAYDLMNGEGSYEKLLSAGAPKEFAGPPMDFAQPTPELPQEPAPAELMGPPDSAAAPSVMQAPPPIPDDPYPEGSFGYPSGGM